MPDFFDDASPYELEMLKIVLQHWRIDEGNGRHWQQLWPSIGGLFSCPIPLPTSEAFDKSQEVDYEHSTPSKPMTPVRSYARQASVPQLEHDESDEEELGPLDGDTPMDEAILEVLRVTDKPIKRITIANKAGYAHSTHLAGRLRRLVNQQRVTMVGGCRYWLACRQPLPEE